MSDREEFEAWWCGNAIEPHRTKALIAADSEWEAWQAALASERAKRAEPVAIYDGDGFITPHGNPVPIGPLYAAPPAVHPAPGYCPQCKQYTIAEPLPPDDEAVRLLRNLRTLEPLDDDDPRLVACRVEVDAYLARAGK